MNNLRETFEQCIEQAERLLNGGFDDVEAIKRCVAYCTGVMCGYYICGVIDAARYEQAHDAMWALGDQRMQRLADWSEFDHVMAHALSNQGDKTNG